MERVEGRQKVKKGVTGQIQVQYRAKSGQKRPKKQRAGTGQNNRTKSTIQGNQRVSAGQSQSFKIKRQAQWNTHHTAHCPLHNEQITLTAGRRAGLQTRLDGRRARRADGRLSRWSARRPRSRLFLRHGFDAVDAIEEIASGARPAFSQSGDHLVSLSIDGILGDHVEVDVGRGAVVSRNDDGDVEGGGARRQFPLGDVGHGEGGQGGEEVVVVVESREGAFDAALLEPSFALELLVAQIEAVEGDSLLFGDFLEDVHEGARENVAVLRGHGLVGSVESYEHVAASFERNQSWISKTIQKNKSKKLKKN